MFIVLKSAAKPSVSVELGRAQSGAHAQGSVLNQLKWEDIRCVSCPFGTRVEHCVTVLSCAGTFGYFCDVVSYGQAKATLVRGEDRLEFTGSAQCVAAFAILACMVYSECGQAVPYSFLLEHFCRVQGQTGNPAFFANSQNRLDRQGVESAVKSGRQSWHEQFDTLLRRKVVSVLGIYDNGGLNDTLRNASQILYSISSLTLDELHADREASCKPGLI